MYRPLVECEGKWEEWDLASSDPEDEETEDEIWNLANMKESTKLLGDEKTYGDPEQNTQKKLKYPKSVFFIIGNEFCERFSYYGMKAILILYLSKQLLFSEDTSTVIYHVWAMLCYFTPILGAIIADSWLGRFKTIFYISIIYVFGNAVLSISAVTPIFGGALTVQKVITFLGLLLIAMGTGGIKPCVSAFGGDQFVLPQQERQLTQFFFVFYFSINAGSLLSTFITPILRDDVSCFGGDCYSLAFGVPAVLMFVALLILVAGYVARMYKVVPPQGTILTEVTGCIAEATRKKWKSKEKKKHWLDHAKDKYGDDLVADVKVLLKILLLYIPLPFFWALFDQQGSRWTFQATRMDGVIGSWTVKPDQMQVVNPLLILIMIPVFDRCVYPLLGRCNILKRQLPRMFTGGVLAGVAFLISGFLEMKLEKTYPVEISNGDTRVTFINTLPCQINIVPSWEDDAITMEPFESHFGKDISMKSEDGSLTEDFNVELIFNTMSCGKITENSGPYNFALQEKTAHVILVTASTSAAKIVNVDPDKIEKSSSGLPRLRMLYNRDEESQVLDVNLFGSVKNYQFFGNSSEDISNTEYQEVEPDSYDVYLPDDQHLGKITVKLGGVYDFLIQKTLDNDNATTYQDVKLYQVTSPNSVHMMWLIPQYFIITASEIMFSITGLEFSFTQAPASMKSVMQAAWLLTVSFGNLIVVIIAEAKIFDRQSMEFFLFAGLMFVDMILFAALAVRYKYVDEIEAEKSSTLEKKGNINEGFSKDETKF
ncbi:Solute carrier family 15 member 1 [Chionoecetes opilio]|uniref:Oligopeptide transporter 1 n=1 Tax=Chionoecetes opilio TaxID=41210 RepID=A0A8J4YII9_CHIOP|nr:Solute carrier family 15 member 1 [Chionoecetes opilio]